MKFCCVSGSILLLLPFAVSAAPAAVLSFSDQTPESAGVEPDPNPYTSAQGLEPGQSILFTGFVANDLGIDPFDHTPDDNNANRMLLADFVGAQSISFSLPTEVSKLYVSLGNGAGESALVTGELAGGGQATLYSDFLPWGEWVEITTGAGLTLTGLSFSGFDGGYIDDITVNAIADLAPSVPEPSLAGLLAALLFSCRRARRLMRS